MGLLWRPLHFNAEAPTEPAGETVATRSVDGGIVKVPQTSNLRHFWCFSFFAQSKEKGFQKIRGFFGKRKNICSILTKLCFVLYGICFDEVHLPSQENEIQNLSQQPTACRKHFFDTLKGAVKTAPFEFNYLLNHLRFGLFVQDFEPVQLCIAHSLCLRNT